MRRQSCAGGRRAPITRRQRHRGPEDVLPRQAHAERGGGLEDLLRADSGVTARPRSRKDTFA